MDMIAEILQTDKAAAGKLEKADMESHYGQRLHSFSANWLRRGRYVRIK